MFPKPIRTSKRFDSEPLQFFSALPRKAIVRYGPAEGENRPMIPMIAETVGIPWSGQGVSFAYGICYSQGPFCCILADVYRKGYVKARRGVRVF